MDLVSSIVLGIVQGATEFLPISSSGHLVLFQNLMGFHEPELLLDTSLHIGTLIAVVIYFRQDLARLVRELREMIRPGPGAVRGASFRERTGNAMLTWVVVGNIPTALIGVGFRDPLENLFGSVSVVACMLVVTGFLLLLTRFAPGGTRRLGLLAALAVGTAQGFAIVPGISRSGATIACGLLVGLDRDLAARYSFLLSVPAIIGALALQLATDRVTGPGFLVLLAGGVVAAVVGLLALKLLMRMVRGGRLSWFAPYCWALGLAVLLLSRPV
jgi:undecaprenyl-diphosphatase